MHENQERPVAADTRNRVIADCAALLPFAQSACAAMDEGDETEVLRLFCGESQRKTLRRLGRLIDDLRLCRTASDLPGPEPEIVELRNASFKVFRGLSARVGNSLDLTKRFRSGAVDFFRMLIRRDPVLLQLVHRGPWRRFAYDLLFAAIKANQYLLQLRQVPSALLRPFRPLVRFHFSNTQMRETPAYEVSVSEAAEALGVSEQTIRNWDQNGCPFDPNYPGRFNAIIFYQWAQTFRSLQNFRREAKKRAVLMNRPA